MGDSSSSQERDSAGTDTIAIRLFSDSGDMVLSQNLAAENFNQTEEQCSASVLTNEDSTFQATDSKAPSPLSDDAKANVSTQWPPCQPKPQKVLEGKSKNASSPVARGAGESEPTREPSTSINAHDDKASPQASLGNSLSRQPAQDQPLTSLVSQQSAAQETVSILDAKQAGPNQLASQSPSQSPQVPPANAFASQNSACQTAETKDYPPNSTNSQLPNVMTKISQIQIDPQQAADCSAPQSMPLVTPPDPAIASHEPPLRTIHATAPQAPPSSPSQSRDAALQGPPKHIPVSADPNYANPLPSVVPSGLGLPIHASQFYSDSLSLGSAPSAMESFGATSNNNVNNNNNVTSDGRTVQLPSQTQPQVLSALQGQMQNEDCRLPIQTRQDARIQQQTQQYLVALPFKQVTMNEVMPQHQQQNQLQQQQQQLIPEQLQQPQLENATQQTVFYQIPSVVTLPVNTSPQQGQGNIMTSQQQPFAAHQIPVTLQPPNPSQQLLQPQQIQSEQVVGMLGTIPIVKIQSGTMQFVKKKKGRFNLLQDPIVQDPAQTNTVANSTNLAGSLTPVTGNVQQISAAPIPSNISLPAQGQSTSSLLSQLSATVTAGPQTFDGTSAPTVKKKGRFVVTNVKDPGALSAQTPIQNQPLGPVSGFQADNTAPLQSQQQQPQQQSSVANPSIIQPLQGQSQQNQQQLQFQNVVQNELMMQQQPQSHPLQNQQHIQNQNMFQNDTMMQHQSHQSQPHQTQPQIQYQSMVQNETSLSSMQPNNEFQQMPPIGITQTSGQPALLSYTAQVVTQPQQTYQVQQYTIRQAPHCIAVEAAAQLSQDLSQNVLGSGGLSQSVTPPATPGPLAPGSVSEFPWRTQVIASAPNMPTPNDAMPNAASTVSSPAPKSTISDSVTAKPTVPKSQQQTNSENARPQNGAKARKTVPTRPKIPPTFDGLGKVFYLLDQMRQEVTDADRTIKTFQTDLKLLVRILITF